MARELGNVLYVLTQGSVLHAEHDTVRIECDGGTRLRVPLLRLDGIVVFGRVTVTPFLIHRCAEDGRFISWLDRRGRYRGRLETLCRGNVLLRHAQHQAAIDAERTKSIAREMVAAKIQNCRQLIMRGARDGDSSRREALAATAARLATSLIGLEGMDDLDAIRGQEGEAARAYFSALPNLVSVDARVPPPSGRSRRPPRDPINTVLSFLYALLRVECASAAEAVGLDPQIGFLHALRPGRPALALDLMEEFRPILADRVALTLVNRRELAVRDFETLPGGAVQLTEDGRRRVIGAYQKRKEREVTHHLLKRAVPLGLVPLLQAQLLARHLRGDLASYPPYLYR